jgi:DNA-binding NarL/FixJ family response regulator
MHAETDLATQAFRAGAVGYVLKSSAAELEKAVGAVLQGRTYVTQRISETVMLALATQTPEHPDGVLIAIGRHPITR